MVVPPAADVSTTALPLRDGKDGLETEEGTDRLIEDTSGSHLFEDGDETTLARAIIPAKAAAINTIQPQWSDSSSNEYEDDTFPGPLSQAGLGGRLVSAETVKTGNVLSSSSSTSSANRSSTRSLARSSARSLSDLTSNPRSSAHSSLTTVQSSSGSRERAQPPLPPGMSPQPSQSTLQSTGTSMRSLRLRQYLSKEGWEDAEEGWEDADIHSPSGLSSLRSSLSTVHSSFSTQHNHPHGASFSSLNRYEAHDLNNGNFHFTPIVDVVPEGDKLSLRDIPLTDLVQQAQQDLRHGQDKDPERKNRTPHDTTDATIDDKRCDVSQHAHSVPMGSRHSITTIDTTMPQDMSTHHTAMDVSPELLTTALAAERIEFIFSDSEFGKLPVDFPRFDASELVTGKHLGTGGFSDVEEIEKIQHEAVLKEEKDCGTDTVTVTRQSTQPTEVSSGSFLPADKVADRAQLQSQSREFVSSRCRNQWGESRYALKRLRQDIQQDHSRAWTGMVDLVVETRILLHMNHPHIIKLRAVAQGDPLRPDYFLVLDRLVETLKTRLDKWKVKRKKKPLLLRPFARKSKEERELWEERLMYAHDLTSALEHMHNHRIIHRDIKPENIGFDLRNDIKVFDFGLSRQIKSTADYYLLSMMTGSLRYMAPEVALGMRYNQCCDVYSFSILLWEMLSLKRPYNDFPSADTLIQRVFEENERPKLPRKWPASLKEALVAGWHADPLQRVGISYLGSMIRKEIAPSNDDDLNPSGRQRRRSTKVYDFKGEKHPVVPSKDASRLGISKAMMDEIVADLSLDLTE